MALGSQVRHYREGLGWTLEKLSDRSGVEIGTISALEKRDSSRSQFGPKLAAALGLTMEQLLDDETDYLSKLKAGEAAGPSMATPAATSIASRWAFKQISPSDWWAVLDDEARMMVEIYARGMLDSARARGAKVANGRS